MNSLKCVFSIFVFAVSHKTHFYFAGGASFLQRAVYRQKSDVCLYAFGQDKNGFADRFCT